MSDNKMPPTDLMEALMKDPVKRALLLQLLNQEKDGFEAYKRRELMKEKTPLKKVKKVHCESPTALQRRRALEQLNQDTTSESSSSEQNEACTEVTGPKLPFEKLLEGITAYVEVKKNNIDKSFGIKAVMSGMGAVVRDKFTNDVTHVVFKDGAFTTYQKAKLMRIHLVSVLWLDAVRRNNARVPEKNYPAFGSNVCEENVSVLCSQLQKDYEDIIKDEKRRSLATFKISKSPDKNRRRTTMISHPSTSRYVTGEKSDEDREVDDILSQRKSRSPDLTSDDSDCGVINGQSSKRSRNKVDLFISPSMTEDISNVSDSSMSSCSKSLFTSAGTKKKRSTIHVISDMVITPNIEQITERVKDKVLHESNQQSSNISSESDKTKSGLDKQTGSISSLISMPEVKSKESTVTTAETTMSSLRLSDSFDKKKRSRSVNKSNSSSEKENEGGSLNKKASNSVRRNLNNDFDIDNDNVLKDQQEINKSLTKVRKSVENTSTEKGKKIVETKRRAVSLTRSERDDQISENESKRCRSVSVSRATRRNRRTICCTTLDVGNEESSKNTSLDESPAKKSRIENTRLKKTRRLYNPNDPVMFSPPRREEEIAEHLKTKSKKSPDDVFLNPNKVIISQVKKTKVSSIVTTDLNINGIIDEEPKNKKREKKKSPVRDSSVDEQKDLLEMVNRRFGQRRSQRLSLSQTKPKYNISSSSSSSSQPSVAITPIKRRSTLDFQSIAASQQRRKLKLDPKKHSSIVCTKFHRNEVKKFEEIVRKLGMFFVENQVSQMTSHLVAGESKRTINMLKAITRGCWIVKHEWLLKSKEEGRWLPEEDYEVREFSPAVQQCRLQRQAFGPNYSIDIFKECGLIYIGKSTTPKQADLRDLITMCQGKVTSIYRNARISVGEIVRHDGIFCVTESWVLDSITFNKLKPFKKYLMKNDGVNSPHY